MSNPNAKVMLFKSYKEDISKKSGNPYRMVELHDPESLDNVSFFLDADSPISVEGLKLRDKVEVMFGMDVRYGRIQPVLQSLKKAI